MEEELANLNIVEDEEISIQAVEDEVETEEDYNMCMVGNILENLWHPLGGISITDIGKKRVQFRIYNMIDLKRVIDGMPWFFNKHLIVFHKLENEEDPLKVPLFYALLWVQIHNLPMGFMSEGMVQQFGNSIGQFMEYNAMLVIRGVRNYMRRMKLDV
ncbi:hypothetical protein J1N35_014152 [Gossypium stocksii]|uniref:DUF4283 domain-containing protein n=1 Tax=Gossypium stocksii TaxID=47602 RepID=A0A9D3VVZ8_9ROSI|nr:hypothetical protein J1N35_014152 [Gossypium stocksii]